MYNVIVLFLCTLQYDNFMAVIELNLPNSPNEISQMGAHFQDEHRFAKMLSKMGECSPIWKRISQVERAPLLYWPLHWPTSGSAYFQVPQHATRGNSHPFFLPISATVILFFLPISA